MVGVLKIHWFLPTGGDARDVLPTAPNANPRAPDLPYLAQVATACDRLGYDGYIGCEYNPRAATLEGLAWFKPYRRV